VVQLPKLGAGCGICVSQAARYGGLQLAYRASSSSVSAGPAGMHLEEFPGHEGNVHVTRLHCFSVSVTLLLRQIITGEVEREADRSARRRFIYLALSCTSPWCLDTDRSPNLSVRTCVVPESLCVISERTLATNARSSPCFYTSGEHTFCDRSTLRRAIFIFLIQRRDTIEEGWQLRRAVLQLSMCL
jgi:hypothetical protein